jgi:PTH1 family peptidyl-tRNA hydrolase
VGFLTADALGERLHCPIQRLKFKALTNVVEFGGHRVLLMKPTTYMNLSGEAAREAALFYKLPPERVLVICDDVSLPVGKLRLRRDGSAGGHNGLRSIIGQLHSDQFPRLKIGVGQKPHPDYDLADWVLGKFSKEDRKLLDQTIERALDALECAISQGLDKAMSRYNG